MPDAKQIYLAELKGKWRASLCRVIIHGDGGKITPQSQVTGSACLFGLSDKAFLLRFSVQTGKSIRANSVESVGEGYFIVWLIWK